MKQKNSVLMNTVINSILPFFDNTCQSTITPQSHILCTAIIHEKMIKISHIYMQPPTSSLLEANSYTSNNDRKAPETKRLPVLHSVTEASGIRTPDNLIKSQVLYQLS